MTTIGEHLAAKLGVPAKTRPTKRSCTACRRKDERDRKRLIEVTALRAEVRQLKAKAIASARFEHRKRIEAERVARRTAEGLCSNCKRLREPDSPSRIKCRRCYEIHRRAVQANREKQRHPCARTGCPNTTLMSELCQSCAAIAGRNRYPRVENLG